MKLKTNLFHISMFLTLLLSPIYANTLARNSEINPNFEKINIHNSSLKEANEYRKVGKFNKAVEVLIASEKNNGPSPIVSERIGRIYNALARKEIDKKNYSDAKVFSAKGSKRLQDALTMAPSGENRQTILLQTYFNSAINYKIATLSQAKNQSSAKTILLASREECLKKSVELLNDKSVQKKKYYGRVLHETGFLLTDRPEGGEASLKSLNRALDYFKRAKAVRTGSDKAMTSSRIIKVASTLGQFDLALDEAIEAAEFYLKSKDIERIGFIIDDIKILLENVSNRGKVDPNKIARARETLNQLVLIK